MSLYYNKKLISGVRDVPSMTLAQYNLLTNKPKLWIRTDAPEGDRGINADDIQYDSNTSVKEKIDDIADYSETEKVVGKWIDGKPLYQKTLSFGALPDNTTKTVSHGISNISKVVSIEGWATNGSDFFSLSYYNPLASSYSAGVYATFSDVIIKTGGNLTPYATCYVTLKYTKTTD